uniref:Peptidase C1A papain C-terminal domain-containing protein n=1 Tax=Dendroctonus ponderosae TaxID=77166 RepID=J3JWF5_DENPD|nr:unknown [Dendroctonus ponderosae]
MKSVLMLVFALGLSSALPSNKPHPLSDEYIAQINSKQSTWKAGRNFAIDEYELFKSLASGVKKPQGLKTAQKLVREITEEIPESFDSRTAWPECTQIIGMIRDQSRCGSCWAFAAVEAMSDRICIHSNATKKLLVSSQDLLTCGTAGGCNGGWPAVAWSDWTNGIVTGGLYGALEQGCKSYFLEGCDDHPNKCRNYVSTPACVEQCDEPSLYYKAQETYGQTPYEIQGEEQIQYEIMTNGPVEATMDVYVDFAQYQSGIYQLTTDEYEGGHAVKILGWGVEDGVKYWLVANSWNERWGENGLFRIIRGRDEVGIESTIDAALPDFTRF